MELGRSRKRDISPSRVTSGLAMGFGAPLCLSPVHTRPNSSAPAEQGWRQRQRQEGQGPSSLQRVKWLMTGGTSLPSRSPSSLLEHSVT